MCGQGISCTIRNRPPVVGEVLLGSDHQDWRHWAQPGDRDRPRKGHSARRAGKKATTDRRPTVRRDTRRRRQNPMRFRRISY